jgi:hypothetical protein
MYIKMEIRISTTTATTTCTIFPLCVSMRVKRGGGEFEVGKILIGNVGSEREGGGGGGGGGGRCVRVCVG